MSKQKLKRTTGVEVIGYIVLGIFALLCIIPFLLMLSSSFSSEQSIILNGYTLWPKEFSLSAYEYLFSDIGTLGRAYLITIIVTVVGTTIHILLATLLGYACSRSDLPGGKVLNFLVIFCMLFNGGMVPTYLSYTTIFHIKDSYLALLVPTLLMSCFNVMLCRNYFKTSIPYSIIEAARIDGAGEFRTFFKVVFPLSLPIIATIGLFAGVAYWNDWYNGMVYLTDSSKYSIQNVLNIMLTNMQFLKGNSEMMNASNNLPTASMRMAVAAVVVVPILCAYPFFQKYFVKGITLGGVKE